MKRHLRDAGRPWAIKGTKEITLGGSQNGTGVGRMSGRKRAEENLSSGKSCRGSFSVGQGEFGGGEILGASSLDQRGHVGGGDLK